MSQRKSEVICAVAEIVGVGEVTELLSVGHDEPLQRFAATACEVLGGGDVPWQDVWTAVAPSSDIGETREVMLISPHRVHVAQRSTKNGGQALLSIAPRTRKVGLILAEARRRLNHIDASKDRDEDGSTP